MRRVVSLFAGVVALGLPSVSGAGEPSEARRPSGELTIVANPYGMNYVRAGFLGAVNVKVPLSQSPGLLWRTTNVTVGVRELFMFTGNSYSVHVEVTPIAFFKLQVSAGYEHWFAGGFNGGFRALTALGRQKLAEGAIGRDDPESLDWSDDGEPGKNNRAFFTAPGYTHALRLRVAPALQGQVGPVVAQYTFTADHARFHAGRLGAGDVLHDPILFSLRAMNDWAFLHEGNVALVVPDIPDRVLVGTMGKYSQVPATDLESLFVGALFYAKPRWRFFDQRVAVFVVGTAGANILDPIYPRTFSWVAAAGADIQIF